MLGCCGAGYQRTIRYRFRDGCEYARRTQHMGAADRRNRFPESRIVRVDEGRSVTPKLAMARAAAPMFNGFRTETRTTVSSDGILRSWHAMGNEVVLEHTVV